MKPLPKTSGLSNLTELKLTGSMKRDRFHLGEIAVNGEFGIDQGLLSRTAGRCAAVQLVSEIGDFELEGQINAESLGGWFWLIGWKDGHGYGIYNVTLKTSGSPWFLSEFRGGVGIAETHQEINRYEWRGMESLRLSVIENRLSLQVGTASLARELELPGYHAGAIILGTYDTPYGPRNIRVQGLRYRKVDGEPD
ncbi:MAG: hypothetical protein SFV23_01940 [Planctomycetaceae bacterium]|nr:hypothetical protein [Planctomycetaceae bacterium]